MQEKRNFAQVRATGKAIDKQLQESKEVCETFASRKSESGLSRWFNDIFVSYSYDTDASKILASESKEAFKLRKQEQARKQLSLLTESMKVASDLNKTLTSANKLYSLVLDFMTCYYDSESKKRFAKVVTIAYDKDNLTSEQVSEFESKTTSETPAYEKVKTYAKDGQPKTYFVKSAYIDVVSDFFAGKVAKVLSRRKDFDLLSEQDVIFFASESKSKSGLDVCTIVAQDRLTNQRLCNFVAFAQYPANKEKIKQLQDQRKQASKERKQAKHASK